MSLLFLDSFDHYDNNHLSLKWTNIFLAGVTAGRNGQGGFLQGGISKTLPARASFVIGFAYEVQSGTSSYGGQVYTLEALNIDRSQSILFQLQLFPDGTFGTYAGDTTLIDNPRSYVYTNNTWVYIEVKFFLSVSGGNIAVQADLQINGDLISSGMSAVSGTPVAGLLSQQALGTYHNFANVSAGEGNSVIDDLYICDTLTMNNKDFLGDVKIGCIYPRVDSLNTGWTPLTGSTVFNLVNEHPPHTPSPDDDTTYTFDDHIGDTYTAFYDTVTSLAGEILACQLNIYARKDDEGSRAVVDTTDGGSYVGPDANKFYLSDNYIYHTFPYDVEPHSGGTWTPAIINATDFGVQLVV